MWLIGGSFSGIGKHPSPRVVHGGAFPPHVCGDFFRPVIFRLPYPGAVAIDWKSLPACTNFEVVRLGHIWLRGACSHGIVERRCGVAEQIDRGVFSMSCGVLVLSVSRVEFKLGNCGATVLHVTSFNLNETNPRFSQEFIA